LLAKVVLVAETYRQKWVLIGASLVTAACLVISPLDEVNDEGAGSTVGGTGGSGAGGTGGSTGGAAGSAGAPACTKHSDCEAEGVPWRCVENQCVRIQSADCPCVPNVPGEVWNQDDSILIAAFAPINSSGADRCDEPASWNYRLAMQEFNDDSVNGLPGPEGTPRRIALVICDNRALYLTAGGSLQTAKNAVMESMDHVTRELKVPGVLAFIDPGMMADAFTLHAKPNGTMFLTPNGPITSFSNIPDESNLAWHMLGLPSDVADTYAALVEKIAPIALTEPLLDQDGGVSDASAPIDASNNPLRVAIIRTVDAFSDDLTPAVQAKLSFNGKTWQENVTAGHAKEFPVAGAESFGIAWTGIKAMKPHIVLSTGFGASSVMNEVSSDGAWQPYVVFSPYDLSDVSAATSWIKATSNSIDDPLFHDRFMWVNVAGSEDVDLLDAYKQRLSSHAGPEEVSAENLYDAAYFLTYAMFAANGTQPPNGLQMGQYGMPELFAASPEVNVGPAYPGNPQPLIPQVLAELAKPEGKVRLNGTMGPPIFDTNGIRRSTGQVDCLIKAPNLELSLREHVAHYDGNSQTLRYAKNYSDGTAPCLKWLNLPLQ
jgi:hypothetical protein